MNSILHFIDWLIRLLGDLICRLFMYVGLPLMAWLLGRRSGRKKRKQSNTFVLIIRPPGKTLSPMSRWTFQSGDDSGPF
jgi:hypothetical protein